MHLFFPQKYSCDTFSGSQSLKDKCLCNHETVRVMIVSDFTVSHSISNDNTILPNLLKGGWWLDTWKIKNNRRDRVSLVWAQSLPGLIIGFSYNRISHYFSLFCCPFLSILSDCSFPFQLAFYSLSILVNFLFACDYCSIISEHGFCPLISPSSWFGKNSTYFHKSGLHSSLMLHSSPFLSNCNISLQSVT